MFCELFGYSKQAYYKQSMNNSLSAIKELQVKESVLLIRRQMPRIGTRKLYYLLKEGFQILIYGPAKQNMTMSIEV